MHKRLIVIVVIVAVVLFGWQPAYYYVRELVAYPLVAHLDALDKAGKHQEALAFADRVSRYPFMGPLVEYRGHEYEKLGRLDEALRDYDRSIREYPRWPLPLAARIHLLIGRKRYAEALEDSEKLVALEPKSGASYLYRGNCRVYLHDYRGAAEDYTTTISLGKAYVSEAYTNRAGCSSKKKDYTAALSDLNQAIRLDPRDEYAYRLRASVYAHKRKSDLALADVDYLARDGRPDSHLHRLRGWVYLQKGQNEAAAREYQEGLRLKDDAAGHNGLSYMYRYLKQHEAALVEADRAVHLEAASFTYSERASDYMGIGRLVEALQDANRVIELSPQEDDGYLIRAAAYFRQHKDAAAEADIEHAIKLCPSDLYCYTDRSYWRRERGDYAGAVSDATTAINLEPDIGMPYAERAKAEEKLNSWQEACSDWKKALGLGWDAKDMKDYRQRLEQAEKHLNTKI